MIFKTLFLDCDRRQTRQKRKPHSQETRFLEYKEVEVFPLGREHADDQEAEVGLM